jgi:hypothetical protein
MDGNIAVYYFPEIILLQSLHALKGFKWFHRPFQGSCLYFREYEEVMLHQMSGIWWMLEHGVGFFGQKLLQRKH